MKVTSIKQLPLWMHRPPVVLTDDRGIRYECFNYHKSRKSSKSHAFVRYVNPDDPDGGLYRLYFKTIKAFNDWAADKKIIEGELIF